VFCPGHGAMAILSHLKCLSGDESQADVAEALFNSKFSLAPYNDKAHRYFLSKLLTHLDEYSGENADPFALFSFFEWQERQSKFLINSARVYDFYGFDWWLPLWDAEFMRFWQTVPLALRRGKEWYVGYVKSTYAAAQAVEVGNASDASDTPGKRWLRRLYHWLPDSWKQLARRCRAPATSSNALEGRYDGGEFKRLFKEGYSKNGMAAYCFLEDFGK